MVIQRSIERRLARLEQRSAPDTGAYIVVIGDETTVYNWHGHAFTLDEWRRRWPNAVDVELGDMPYKLYKDFEPANA
jgi:hypothetical protein